MTCQDIDVNFYEESLVMARKCECISRAAQRAPLLGSPSNDFVWTMAAVGRLCQASMFSAFDAISYNA
jgi:hypothetical protein